MKDSRSCSTRRCRCSAPASPVARGAVPPAAGAGTLGIVDDDVVDVEPAAPGDPYDLSVRDAESRLGRGDDPCAVPGCAGREAQAADRAGEMMDVLPNYDIVVDGLELPDWYLLNDASVRRGSPSCRAVIPRLRLAAVGVQAVPGPSTAACSERRRRAIRSGLFLYLVRLRVRRRRSRTGSGSTGPRTA